MIPGATRWPRTRDRAAARRDRDEEPAFDAPDRGSADELLDAGAHAPIDAMRHSTAHVMAEAVLDLFPGAKLGIGPAIHDGFYYDFDLPRAAHARRPRGDRGPDARVVAADHAFVRKEVPCEEGRALEESKGQPFKVEILDDLARKAQEAGTPLPPTSLLRARPVQRPVQGPARRVDGPHRARSSCSPSPARTGGATRSARCSSGSTARSGRRRRSSTSTSCRREEAKKRDHRKLGVAARPVLVPRRLAGLGVLAPQGPADLADARGRDARAAGPPRLPGGLDADPRLASACGASPGHWDHYADNMFIVEAEGQKFSLKPMNCPESTFIYRSHLRSYRDLPLRFSEFGRLHRNERSGALSGLTRVRQFIQDDAHIYVRPDQLDGRDRGAARRGPRVVRLVRARAAVRVRDPARQGDRRPGAVGPRRGADQGGARPGRAATTWSSPRTGRSTRPRSTSTSTTRWAASGRWRRSRSTSRCCPSGST